MPSLVHVDFNLTNACNLACTHCHSASGKALPSELTTAEIKDAVSQAHQLGALSIAFAGGEPFMRSDLLEILQHATNLPGWRVSAITNGLFLTDRSIATLLEACPEVGLNISVDGSTPDSFGLLRAQPGATPAARAALFRRVTDGVRRAARAGLDVSVNTTMTKAGRSDLVATYDFAIEELGAQSMVAIKFFPAGFGREHLDLYDFSWPEWAEFFADLTRLRLSGGIPKMQLSVPSPWEFYLPLIDAEIDIKEAESAWDYRSPLREASYARSRDIGDVAGWAELCIAGDGTVYPSVLMVGESRELCGSLREQSLQEIWARSERLSDMRSLRVADIGGGCRTCSLRSICGGGSRSRALADFGDVSATDAACPLTTPVASLEIAR
ncbi:radical SAM/SPASM domain-containing protein [Streptomyces canus]|uniref:Radical SAM protein with 4Fe4S-binding SPASM domain n=1 Tax=Streptomyces canus TaxID=58343 RepID=A0AAW8F9V4_9ACTN|nr:radical SAM protein [Streptomyces canus]MDQ0906579.1 radical SAM protein with 4Fe4S-binding SPASM domain [Streptomyces canus]MDQ1066599.1 radical SAM protein with 4Fe4S-binding SPASM domain [Streptomyces canus]